MQSIPGILLDRVGIVLEIIAFFFVTPELLGNERLITIAVWFSARLARVNAVLKPIARTMSPRFLFGVLVFILLAAVVTAIFQGASGSNELHQTILILLIVIALNQLTSFNLTLVSKGEAITPKEKTRIPISVADDNLQMQKTVVVIGLIQTLVVVTIIMIALSSSLYYWIISGIPTPFSANYVELVSISMILLFSSMVWRTFAQNAPLGLALILSISIDILVVITLVTSGYIGITSIILLLIALFNLVYIGSHAIADASRILAAEANWRRLLIWLGVFLFVISKFVQLSATFLKSD